MCMRAALPLLLLLHRRLLMALATEAYLGPLSWGKNFSAEASNLVRNLVPAARGVMRNFRARKGPDAFTIIVYFETAEITTWFVKAFNSAPRQSPYEHVMASPLNV
ncbi:hypothetical protein FB45DRAFT_1020193 [Roridomyces roridus]|uniref:Secreted protein n=1 Tax=Roridomyces roridus TaxID=1738132 RepID=A0AAD7CGI6_9AGAR|nr:hypothetical protein FB45DRAFT_1020193 [Roridomyces roridus]